MRLNDSEVLRRVLLYSEQHLGVSIFVGAVAAVGVLRGLWLLAWWLLFTPSMHALGGVITCDGVNIEEGSIAFEPAEATRVPSRTAQIRNGVFQLRKESGVRRGVGYVLRVEGFRKTGVTHPGPDGSEGSEEYEQYVLPAFNRESSTEVLITRAVLREGVRLDVKGVPLPVVKPKGSAKPRAKR